MILSAVNYTWVAYGLVIAYFTIIIMCICVVLSENRNPIRSLAWTIALLALPGIGLIFYLFFGRSLRGMHMISRHSKRKLLHNYRGPRINLSSTTLSPAERQLVKLGYTLTGSPLTMNNDIEVFTSGEDKFNALKRDLKSAESSIYLQYYIFNDDKIGNEIADLLMDKARSGVDVKVIYDHVGSLSTSKKFFKKMQDAGVDIHPFFRVTFRRVANRINWRNHRKIVLIDNNIGYIGGMNIADRYVEMTSAGEAWRDTHFRVRGDVLRSMAVSFALDWHFTSTSEALISLDMPVSGIINGCGVQLVNGSPLAKRNNLTLCYLRIIASAKKSIYIQTPYFLPTDSLMNALEAAALSKVDVRIMLPRRTDSRMLQYASFSYVTQCLQSSIKVYLYEPGMLHAKTMIVDENFVTAGSTNFDFRSFENNFECNLMIYDETMNRKMREIFFEDLANCRRLTVTEWKKRPLIQRGIESIVRLFAPIL